MKLLYGSLLSLCVAASVFGQANTGGANTGGNFQGAVGGVYVDAQGVLRARKTVDKGAVKAARKTDKEGWTEVSLRDLVAKLKKSGRPEDAAERCLGGLTRIDFLFVDQEKKDLIFAGPSEPIFASDEVRPVGAITGRPMIRLDDLVVALRAFRKDESVFGCSLDLPEGINQRLVQIAREIGGSVQGTGSYKNVNKLFASKIGHQDVRSFGVPRDSQFALVCLEADVLMKRLALGLDRSPVKGVTSHLAIMKANEGSYSRYWFQPNYEPIVVADDGSGYEIRKHAMRVQASDSPSSDEGNGSESARKFAERVTEHFEELAEQIPAFADLTNLTDIAIMATLIDQDQLDGKVSLDLDWVRDAKNYQVAKFAVPKTAEVLVNSKAKGMVLTLAVGGVQVDTSPYTITTVRQQAAKGEQQKSRAGKKTRK